jgi:alanine racemase
MQDFSHSSGILTINLNALEKNYQTFQHKVGANCAVAGVVKADAYGLGFQPVVEKLTELGCSQFFVATLEEAIQLRGFNKNTPVAVLGGLYHGAENEYVTQHITPVLNSPDDIARWKNISANKEKALSAILHIDTAMNRLGLSAMETEDLINHIESLGNIDVQTIMTHFACADDKDHPLTQTQADRFVTIALKFEKYFPKASKSLANSSGLFRNDDFHLDMVRPGYALYGGNPTPENANPMQRVVDLSVRILQVRACKKGETIGYGAGHKFTQDTQTATVALGYADGFLRSHSGQGQVYWQGQPCPVLGRVSMDAVTIDLSQIEGALPTQGDQIEILGPNQSVDDIANAAGTIGYEVLTSLGARYRRLYV